MTKSSIQTVLEGLRTHFGLEVAFVSEFVEGERVFRYVDSVADDCPVLVDGSDSLDGSYCGYVVRGLLPQVMQDASSHPVARRLPATQRMPVGAHLSVPILMSDGTVFGTL